MPASVNSPWLFGRRADLLLFGGSTAVALLFLGIGHATGLLDGDAPPWLFLVAVVGVDVAHVWSTGWRVLADGSDGLARASGSTRACPLAAWCAGVLAYSVSPLFFWRVLAYLAVFHFMRQQYGWVALYRRKNGEGRDGRLLDAAAIYGATLTPLLFWHAHLPRKFQWFLKGDFLSGLPDGRQPRRVRPLRGNLRRVDRKGARAGPRRPAGVVGEGPDRPLDRRDVVPRHRRLRLGLRVHGPERLRPRHPVHGPRVVHVEGARRRRASKRASRLPSRTGSPRSSSSSSRRFSSSRSSRSGAGTASSGTITPCSSPDPPLDPGALLLALIVPLLALPQATHYVWDAFLWKVKPANAAAVAALGIR